jgi:hypothetical protein
MPVTRRATLCRSADCSDVSERTASGKASCSGVRRKACKEACTTAQPFPFVCFFSLFCLPLERSFFKNVAAMRRSVFRAGSSALRLKVQRCPQKDGTRMLISPSSRSSTKAVVAQVAEGGGQSAASDAILTACCFLSVSSPLVCSTDAAACARAAPGAAAFRARCRRRRASGGRAAARRRRRRRQTRSAGRARG